MQDRTTRMNSLSAFTYSGSPKWLLAGSCKDEKDIDDLSVLVNDHRPNDRLNDDEQSSGSDKNRLVDFDGTLVGAGLITEEVDNVENEKRSKHLTESNESNGPREDSFDINVLGRSTSSEDITFIKEDGEVLQEDEYPVNIVFREKRILDGYIVGLKCSNEDNTRWMMVRGEPIFKDNGEIERVALYSMDVTDMKKEHECLVRRRGELEGTLGKISNELEVVKSSMMNDKRYNGKVQLLSNTGSFEYDPASGIFKGSRLCNRILGFEDESDHEIESILESIGENERIYLESMIKETLKNDGPRLLEVNYSKEGDEIPLLMKMISHKNEINGRKTIIGIIQDISREKLTKTRMESISNQLENLNRVMFERESRVLEIKEEVNDLCRELGREPKYKNI